MKTLRTFIGVILAASIFLLGGCDSFLQEDVYSELVPENFITTDEGISAVLASAYAGVTWTGGTGKYRTMHVSDWTTDIAWQTGGGENREAAPMINFSWDPATNVQMMYNRPYGAIRDANIVLANIDGADVAPDKLEMLKAEARFIRALAYRDLYNFVGPAPLRTHPDQEVAMARASEEEMRTFIETEFEAAAAALPAPGQEPAYGRATKGSALGWLTKWYLNTHQWQKAADAAKRVMDLGYYSLYPEYGDMFKVENEGNREMIWVDASSSYDNQVGNAHMNGAFPPAFASDPKSGLVMQANWANWASQYRLRDAFFNSFEEGDARTDLILTSYVNKKGNTVSLLNADNTRPFKYWPDPNASGNAHGNDHPRIRYADILLSRAEALNELQGPNAESVELLNMVRRRAKVADKSVGDFPSKDTFRDHLMNERAWEFYIEGLRREDLIRWGKYIEFARARGISNASDHHQRFPIPQQAIDANPLLQQNPGY